VGYGIGDEVKVMYDIKCVCMNCICVCVCVYVCMY